ncbi:5,10-methenyltetrahydromethanopterin hydrogenase cofactor biosynthesis protein HmdC [Methanomicrobium sp. W14]|uniref:5,10-methenyltetrahydromethanopterin hydrogenase cofactor biosynthesis protein HmdC n=1 Tax=Methanomicrobium sp. W14 TaxID=2817839 RepID=UPI001AE8FCD7|nr:5,10-methenyltetrahydromethanopterin hydrogenase cofactor biosynthesis protein HmdC [Methanomicrobium sp. W14]MBP2133578.1 5,10-methenyltetrahydromethanopterin hydrogenase cofactor biosynthesis protein HmdC [Methanomicrobium sp. W14]
MEDVIRRAVSDPMAAWELSKTKKDPAEIVECVSRLDRNETMKLGMNFKRFPIGCDLTEVLVGTCASDLDKIDIMGNSFLSDSIGASVHVCAYAFADIAEANGMKGIDLFKEIRENTEVPLDLDHFGSYGPMRFPKEITGCSGWCYNQGPPFEGCPRDRIHVRLVDKEKEDLCDRDEWVKVSSSVAVNLTCVQGAEGHAAPLKEAVDVAGLAKKYGKPVEAIMFAGDGYEDLIKGFSSALDIGADIFVIEGGPFNRAENRLDAFSRAVAVARILAPGKIVVTNGAYEDECRIGLRSGLNGIITGFPKNHHGYMCGYSPGTAKRGRFGLPRVMQIIREEVKEGLTHAPIGKGELESLARAVKAAGQSNVYPEKIGYTYVGDAHWVSLPSTPLYERVSVKNTVSDIVKMADEGIIGESVALLGGRFVSWVIAKELDGRVDRIRISDADSWVEQVTVDNLSCGLKSEVCRAYSDDKAAYDQSDSTIICSTIPFLSEKISCGLKNSIKLV